MKTTTQSTMRKRHIPILAVDNSSYTIENEVEVWAQFGIEMKLAKCVEEALFAVKNGRYIGVAINADAVDYFPKLKLLRDTAPMLPIMPITNNFTPDDFIRAVDLGADGLFNYQESSELNVQLSLAFIARLGLRGRNERCGIHLLKHKEILMARDYRAVFFGEKGLELGNYEFELLCRLLERKGRICHYEDIYKEVYGEKHYVDSLDPLFKTMGRLRAKLREVCDPDDYLENVARKGYILKL